MDFPTDKHLFRTDAFRCERNGRDTVVELTVWLGTGTNNADLVMREVPAGRFRMNDPHFPERETTGRVSAHVRNQRLAAVLVRGRALAAAMMRTGNAQALTSAGFDSVDEFVHCVQSSLFTRAPRPAGHGVDGQAPLEPEPARWVPLSAGEVWF